MLSDADKARFSRHLLLSEIGTAGQSRLCAARVRLPDAGDTRAGEIAREYLLRAGIDVVAGGTAAAREVPVASPFDVTRLGADPSLDEAAAWFAGAFAAVEAIKSIVGVGRPAALDPLLSLAAEAR